MEGKTFADIARRYNKKDLEGEERPTSGPVSLAGLIKLQPNRRKNNKPWRPMQLSDFGEDGNDNGLGDSGEFGANDFASLAHSFNRQPKLELDSSRPASSSTSASPFDLPPLQTNMASSPLAVRPNTRSDRQRPGEVPSAFVRENSEDISPTNTGSGVVGDYARLFGKQLPDPIRLHEEMGEFDGQIIFIGHPNRDVSAHQWIEGSLASDRLRGVNIPHHSIEYFKAVSEQREKNVRKGGREAEKESSGPSSGGLVEAPRRPDITDPERVASLSSASDSTSEHLPTLNPMSLSRESTTVGGQTTVTEDYLEDPFVTPAKAPQPAVPSALNFRNGNTAAMGSMDFDYEFPTKSAASRATGPLPVSSGSDSHQVFIQRERDRLESMRRGINPREHESQSSLREVDFGEEAMSGYGTPGKHDALNRLPVPMSPEDLHNRQILKNKLAELSDQARRSSLPVDQRVAIPDVQGLQGLTRALFAPGLTVANPHRVVSTLNANAAPYTRQSMYAQPPGDSESEITTVNAPPAANLQFSDPDAVRPHHVHEIANGLGHQAPTPQNFKGPFFTDTMPTTHDPTASLSFQVSEQEKLANWFRDGQRPARQQEYSRTLMATALRNTIPRSTQNFGAIGDASSRAKDHGKYEDTPAFVRLYENLNEYVDESRVGRGGSDYFTRGWKPAPLHLRDLGPDGNNSFFGEDYGTSPQIQRMSNRGLQPYGGPTWGGYGLSNPVIGANRYSHGAPTDGVFGDPSSGRF